MTTTNLPLVMGRIRGSDPKSPRFTASTTHQDLMAKLAEQLPVDLIYFVVPHPDGKGFSLREAGQVVLDIQVSPDLDMPLETVTPKPLQPPAPPAPTELAPTVAEIGQQLPQDYVFGVQAPNEPDPFKFERPRSQAELLKERGIEQPKVNLAPKKKTRGKSRAKALDDIPDDQLPNPVSLGGRVQTNHISTATQAEQAAASKFNRSEI